MKKIVSIGGGTGQGNLLFGLRSLHCQISAIVTTMDSGGSTGRIREEFGTLAYGDLRQCMLALSANRPIYQKLFGYRFQAGRGLKGHSFGNLLLLVLNKITGSEEKALILAQKMLGVKDRVLPVALQSSQVCARLEDSRVIVGEANIDVPKHNADLKIADCFLRPKVQATKETLSAIHSADVIVMGPGDFYTSLIPNILVAGVKEAIRKSRAKKVLVINLMTKHGETDGFTLSTFVECLEKYSGKNVLDCVIYNNKKISPETSRAYQKEQAYQVGFKKSEIVKLQKRSIIVIGESLIKPQSQPLRHNSKKLAKIINKYWENFG